MLPDPTVPANRLWSRPLYLQLRDALAERIAGGAWKPGTAIPNESELAREFNVSAGTMRKALDLMEGERLLTRRQGRGTFVNDQTSHELALRFSNLRLASGERISGQIETVDISEKPASEAERARLRLGPKDRVYRMRRRRIFENRPFMIEDVSLPAALFPALTDRMPLSQRVTLLAQQYGILLGKAEERITLGLASADAAKALTIEVSSPVLVLDRVVLTLDARPVEWRLAQCHLAGKYYMAQMT
jgi:GntR family transcriptional regulator